MAKTKIYIQGMGSYLPTKVLSNADLEKMVDTSDEWITSRTGIRERRIASAEQATSDLGWEAARLAIADAKLTPQDVDAILVSSVTPDMDFPATACIIQDKLGITNNCPSLDLEAGCSGLIYAMELAAAMVERGPYNHILVVASDKLSAITDWQDRSTCVLLADGASAVVMGKDPKKSRAELLASHLMADGSMGSILSLPGGGSRLPASEETVKNRQHFLKMNGRELFKYAVKNTPSTLEHLFAMAQVDVDQIRYFIPHQANMRIVEAIAEHLHLPLDRFITTLQYTGNTSSGSPGIAMNDARLKGKFADGDLICLVAFGAGMTIASSLLRWMDRPGERSEP
jgi:3-oxoacyl-[acyl-carrier-protein] synthase-3